MNNFKSWIPLVFTVLFTGLIATVLTYGFPPQVSGFKFVIAVVAFGAIQFAPLYIAFRGRLHC